jgi:hypothetical protein
VAFLRRSNAARAVVTPFPSSLCHGCAHLRLVESAKGSTFLMCREPTLPKYPPQPVTTCRGFTPRA